MAGVTDGQNMCKKKKTSKVTGQPQNCVTFLGTHPEECGYSFCL